MVWEKNDSHRAHKNLAAMADYRDWKARNRVFAEMTRLSIKSGT
jgi:hypothetical protein